MTRRRRLTLGLLALVLLLGLHPAAQAQEQETDSPDIIGGGDADIGDHPYVAAVLTNPPGGSDPFFGFRCSATLISTTVALTAGSCVTTSGGGVTSAGGLEVLTGEGDLEQDGGTVHAVTAVGRAPGWEDGDIPTNDLAFLRLATPVAEANTLPVATPDDSPTLEAETPLDVLGWGASIQIGEAVGFPNQLQLAEVPFNDDAACTTAHETYDPDTGLCAGGLEAGPCVQDAGAPLVYEEPPPVEEEEGAEVGDRTLVGVSHERTTPCADAEVPDPYVDVTAFEEVIEVYLDAPAFTDVDWNHPFFFDVASLKADGVIGGFPDGSFRSNDPVSRQAMSAFIYRLRGEPEFEAPATPTFADVPTNAPFYDEIEWMASEGITTGYATTPPTYRPAEAVNRQAMSAFMYRTAGEPEFEAPGVPTFADVPLHHPFYDEIEWMASEGITTGYPTTPRTFRPNEAVSRQAMSAFMSRLQPLLEPPPPAAG